MATHVIYSMNNNKNELVQALKNKIYKHVSFFFLSALQ